MLGQMLCDDSPLLFGIAFREGALEAIDDLVKRVGHLFSQIVGNRSRAAAKSRSHSSVLYSFVASFSRSILPDRSSNRLPPAAET